MIIKNRLLEHIPILVCQTCGKVARQRQVIELEDPALRNERRKTWNRIIKPSFNVHYSGMQKRRNKRIFYAAVMQVCINKRHKILVKHLNDLHFHRSFSDTVNEIKEKRERIERKKVKLAANELVNCASCNVKTSIYEVCMKCGRCKECCTCKARMTVKRDKKEKAK